MIQVQDLCIHALDQLLAAAHPGLCADNWELLKTWEPLDALRHRIVDKGEAFQTLLRLYQEPPEWHYQRPSRRPCDDCALFPSRLGARTGVEACGAHGRTNRTTDNRLLQARDKPNS